MQVTIHAFRVLALFCASLLLAFPNGAHAQAFEKDWKLSLSAGHASLKRYDEGIIWDSVTNDSGAVGGLALSYYVHPNVSVRAGFETGDSFTTQNACPVDAEACPLIVIEQGGDLRHMSLALIPEVSLSPQVDLYGILGVAQTRLSAGIQIDPAAVLGGEANRLAGYNKTGLIYGVGLGYRFNNWLYLATEVQYNAADYHALRVSLGIRF